MSISLLILLGLLLSGMALTYLVATRWPRYVTYIACGVVGLGLLAWLALGHQLPQTVSLATWPDDGFFPLSWQWQVGEAIWPLSGILLLLLFALLLFRVGQPATSDSASGFSLWLSRSAWQSVLMLALGVAGLSVIWAATLATLMVTWTLLAILWVLYLLTTGKQRTDPAPVLHSFFWMLAPLLFAGIAAATQPVGSEGLDMSNWSPTATTAILLTSMAQMGIMPFVGWRPHYRLLSPSDGPILHLIPSLVGAGLLIRLRTTANIDPAIILLLTVFALITILTGVRRAWVHIRSNVQLPADLAYSLSGFAFLVGIWAGSEALVAGIRLLVLALTILFLLESLPILRTRWWRGLAPMLALLSLAGFPLTAGFVALTSVYNVWLTNSLLILVLALTLLLLPLITAVLIFIRDNFKTQDVTNGQKSSVIMEIGQMIPAIGLIMIGIVPLDDIKFGTWLAMLASAGGALLLTRYVGEVQGAVSIVDTALSTDKLPFAGLIAAVNKVGRQVLFTLSEAAFIMEGDRGLLWLTAFLAILLFAISS